MKAITPKARRDLAWSIARLAVPFARAVQRREKLRGLVWEGAIAKLATEMLTKLEASIVRQAKGELPHAAPDDAQQSTFDATMHAFEWDPEREKPGT